MATFYRGEGVRFRVLHRYVRRLIDWATTPSDEEAAAARNERRLARVACSISSAPVRVHYLGASPLWRAERKADIIALRATGRVPDGPSSKHLQIIEFMDSNDGNLPDHLFERKAS